jgi:hypothetical protein
MSAVALAEYLILQPDQQENILHDCRFARPPIVTANGDAMRALRAYNGDRRRDQSALERVKAALTIKSQSPEFKPKTQDEARRCKEAIELFQKYENAFGMRHMALSECERFGPLDIEGVSLSIQPDLLVEGGDARFGAAIIRVAKSPDPAACKLEATRLRRGDHRREMGWYLVAMLQLLIDSQGGSLGKPDRDLCFVADVRLGERIGPAEDHTKRIRAIKGACRQIGALWPTIKPKPSVLAK